MDGEIKELFEEACKSHGGMPQIKSTPDQLQLYCHNLASDKEIAEVYQALKNIEPDGYNIISILYGESNNKIVFVSISNNGKKVRIQEKRDATKFADGMRKEIDYNNKRLEIDCNGDKCDVTFTEEGALPDYFKMLKEINRNFAKTLEPFFEFADLFVKECKSNGGEVKGVICYTPSTEAADKMFDILRNYIGEICPSCSSITAGIKYHAGSFDYELKCKWGNICEYYHNYSERADIPEDILKSKVLVPFLSNSRFNMCIVNEEGVECSGKALLLPYNWKTNKPSEVANEETNRVKDLVNILVQAAEDLKTGNVWKQKRVDRVCGTSFVEYDKDGKEVILGLSPRVSGHQFISVKYIPDTIMKEFQEEHYVGDTEILSEIKKECKMMEGE